MDTLYADFHIHTVYSSDSLIQPKTLIDMLLEHNYVKVAAITDHDSTRACKATITLAAAYPDILIIPGVEITTTAGDMLILGTEELPPKPWTPQNVADYAKTIGAVSIIAHPYRLYGMGDTAKTLKIDAIEILNGNSSTTANQQAKQLAQELKLPGTAGSDAHQTSELFTVYNKIQADLNIDSILHAIKKGQITPTTQNNLFPYNKI
ncbi:MAG: CehA/McbA family metallohydrolase [Candidatus Bathyarchaeota archaeon]|uniref:PHP domain-containing protein n=1 Tax=Candidatus Bathycorpusculum sp. TaxID=2994959 RepID=UPI00283911D5|nr:CehA/McbA family metallohydrolase [Candidatus Termiticorpusculum sp.]MCL2257009.1 CehA/McbA family metallohydrolase [Candidatus Termiticorpusculum sp.]MCL2292867.1 CehA/McbA family metallohydrolase [Candidatus Termiticorpusculum sp.]